MRGGGAAKLIDTDFDMPPLFVVAERRMAGRAVDRWRAGSGGLVDGFEANSLIIVDPGGAARCADVGSAIESAFGLAAGMSLTGRDGLAAEIRAACDLIARDPHPVPFEASLPGVGAGLLLVRGVALPIGALPMGALPAGLAACIQVVANWREVLDRESTTRLRRDLGAELRLVASECPKTDPFLSKIGD